MDIATIITVYTLTLAPIFMYLFVKVARKQQDISLAMCMLLLIVSLIPGVRELLLVLLEPRYLGAEIVVFPRKF